MHHRRSFRTLLDYDDKQTNQTHKTTFSIPGAIGELTLRQNNREKKSQLVTSISGGDTQVYDGDWHR